MIRVNLRDFGSTIMGIVCSEHSICGSHRGDDTAKGLIRPYRPLLMRQQSLPQLDEQRVQASEGSIRSKSFDIQCIDGATDRNNLTDDYDNAQTMTTQVISLNGTTTSMTVFPEIGEVSAESDEVFAEIDEGIDPLDT